MAVLRSPAWPHNHTFCIIYQPKPEHKHPKFKEFLPKAGEMFFDFGDLIKSRVKGGR